MFYSQSQVLDLHLSYVKSEQLSFDCNMGLGQHGSGFTQSKTSIKMKITFSNLGKKNVTFAN